MRGDRVLAQLTKRAVRLKTIGDTQLKGEFAMMVVVFAVQPDMKPQAHIKHRRTCQCQLVSAEGA